MAFLGSKNCHEPCQVRIQKYLEKDNRAIGHDFVNIITPDEMRAWGYFMDKTRAFFQNDSYTNRKPVMYYHFIISPDPRDEVDLQTLRSLTLDWVHHFFGDDFDSGVLGSYEVAIVYHDDNTHHIPHAHIVVNNTNIETGRRLHLDNKTNRKLLPDKLQELAKEKGLRYFDNSLPKPSEPAKSKRYYTRLERRLLREKRMSWKEQLAHLVDIAKKLTSNVEEFESELSSLDVSFYVRDDDYVYSHPGNPKRWTCSGYRLGQSFTKENIDEYFENVRKRNLPRSHVIRGNINTYLARNAFSEVSDHEIDSPRIAVSSDVVKDVGFALGINDKYGFRLLSDYHKKISELERDIARTRTPSSKEALQKQLKNIHRALRVLESAHMWDGIEFDVSYFDYKTVDTSLSGSRSRSKTRRAASLIATGSSAQSKAKKNHWKKGVKNFTATSSGKSKRSANNSLGRSDSPSRSSSGPSKGRSR